MSTEKMKGYIYITGTGTDPGLKSNLNDPLFGEAPSLGACMPNIRRLVSLGDYIFVVSGTAPGVQQYIVGGMAVSEKISTLEAYHRFPQNRLRKAADGTLEGNIIVNADGTQHALDGHAPETFENRIKNYIVGKSAISLDTKPEVELGRQRSLAKLSDLFGKSGNRPIDVMGRWGKLNERQVRDVISWLEGLKRDAAR